MYFAIHGYQVQGLFADPIAAKEWATKKAQTFVAQYDAQKRSNGYLTRQFPDGESYAGHCLQGYKIFKWEVGTVDFGSYNFRTPPDNVEDVTAEFFGFVKEQVKVGEHITARVVKKGLKSYGKTVVIETRLNKNANTVAPTPAEWKQMYDQMARIVCCVDSWGKITVAPDALDEYRMTPKMKEVLRFKLVE